MGDWYNSLQAARDLATRNNMKATTRAEHDHNKRAELHDYKVGQQIWLDERNFLSKNQKLASKCTGPYLITKVGDDGNIRIQLDKKEINANVNRIKPFIAIIPEEPQQHQQQPQQPQIQLPHHNLIIKQSKKRRSNPGLRLKENKNQNQSRKKFQKEGEVDLESI